MSILSILGVRFQLLTSLLEELRRLKGVLSSHVMERSGRNVVGLSFADKRVVFEEVLQFGGIQVGLRLEDLLRFVPATRC